MSRVSSLYLFAMAFVLMLGFALGVNGLMRRPILIDEMYSLTHMGVFAPPFNMADVYESLTVKSPNQLPLYYWLGAFWGQAVGWSQAALRALSLLLGMITIALVYRFGSEAFSRRTGLVSALLLCTSVFVLVYLTLIRMYVLLLLLAALNGWLYWMLAYSRRFTRVKLGLFALSSALLLYTHFLSLVWLASFALHHLLFVRQFRRFWPLVLGWALGWLLFMPVLPAFVRGLQYSHDRSTALNDTSSTLDLIPAFIELLANGAPVLILLAVIPLILAVRRSRNSAAIKLVILLLLQLALMLLADALINLAWLSRMRYFLMLWIPACIVLAYCISAVPNWKVIGVLALLLWLAAGLRFYQSSRVLVFADGVGATATYPPLQHIVPQLAEVARSEDFLLGMADREYVNNTIRMGKSIADYYLEALLDIEGDFLPRRLTGEALRQRFDSGGGKHPDLLLLYDSDEQPAALNELSGLIGERYTLCEPRAASVGMSVERYVLRSLPCDRAYRPIEYENGIRVVDSFALYNADAQSVGATIGWEVPDVEQLYRYNVSIQIQTLDGTRVSQAPDRHFYDDVLKWYQVDMSTEGLPPGEYRVVVIVYSREQSSARVQGVDMTSGELGDMLSILEFTIE